MAADIQRVRWALAKVEEKFNENPNFAVGNTVMKQLLDLYKVRRGLGPTFVDIFLRGSAYLQCSRAASLASGTLSEFST